MFALTHTIFSDFSRKAETESGEYDEEVIISKASKCLFLHCLSQIVVSGVVCVWAPFLEPNCVFYACF